MFSLVGSAAALDIGSWLQTGLCQGLSLSLLQEGDERGDAGEGDDDDDDADSSEEDEGPDEYEKDNFLVEEGEEDDEGSEEHAERRRRRKRRREREEEQLGEDDYALLEDAVSLGGFAHKVYVALFALTSPFRGACDSLFEPCAFPVCLCIFVAQACTLSKGLTVAAITASAQR